MHLAAYTAGVPSTPSYRMLSYWVLSAASIASFQTSLNAKISKVRVCIVYQVTPNVLEIYWPGGGPVEMTLHLSNEVSRVQ